MHGSSERRRGGSERARAAACLAAAAVLASVALAGPAIAARPGIAVFDGEAFAAAVEATFNLQPPMVFTELGRLDIPYGASRLSSGGVSAARAASAYPGTLVTQGPAFINAQVLSAVTGPMCEAGFPCELIPPPPAYPLSADAQYPTSPEASAAAPGQTVAVGPLSFNLLDVRAHAGAEEATTTAIIGDLTLLAPIEGVPGSAIVHVDHLEARTSQGFDAAGAYVVRSTARLQGIALFGDAVRIATLESVSVAGTEGDAVGEGTSGITVGAVSVNGQEATLTDRGLVAAGNPAGSPIGALAGPVAQALQATGQSVRLIDATHQTDDGTVSADATGLLAQWRLDASAVPAGTTLLGDLVLGVTSASAYASRQLPTAPPSLGGGLTGVTALDGLPGVLPGPTVVEPAAIPPAPAGAGAVPATARRGQRPAALEFLGGLAARRITLLYLASALAAAGLCFATVGGFRWRSHRHTLRS